MAKKSRKSAKKGRNKKPKSEPLQGDDPYTWNEVQLQAALRNLNMQRQTLRWNIRKYQDNIVSESSYANYQEEKLNKYDQTLYNRERNNELLSIQQQTEINVHKGKMKNLIKELTEIRADYDMSLAYEDLDLLKESLKRQKRVHDDIHVLKGDLLEVRRSHEALIAEIKTVRQLYANAKKSNHSIPAP